MKIDLINTQFSLKLRTWKSFYNPSFEEGSMRPLNKMSRYLR